MKSAFVLLFVSTAWGCAPETPPRTGAHSPLIPEPEVAAPLAPAPIEGPAAHAVISWMFGAWACNAGLQQAGSSTAVHASGRLIVDAYMDVWIGAGFEPEAPGAGIPKGDFYFTYDTATSSWALVGFMSDGSRYNLSSPGEIGGRFDWTGSSTRSGSTKDLRAVWEHHPNENELTITLQRREPAGWATMELACRRQR